MKGHYELRSHIVRNRMTLAGLATKLHISNTAMTNKMNGRSPFTVDEAIAICDLLHIPYEQIKSIFQEE